MTNTACAYLLLAYGFLSTIAPAQTASDPATATTVGATLPTPSGSYSIGRQAFDLVDSSRKDEFSEDKAKSRELMVYVWYPAQPSSPQTPAEYFPGAGDLNKNPTAQDAVHDLFGPAWPLIVSGSIAPHAGCATVPITQPGGFPVVLFSHGLSATTFSYTAQIEDLVSHGYVVVAIEHTDAAGLVLFPDGRIRTVRESPAPVPSPKEPLQAMIESAKKGTQTGAEDVRFVLDTLVQKKIPIVAIMDLNRVAAVGHSYGGTLTARACQLDTRIKACISEDGAVNPVGAFFDYPGHAKLKQPFLLLDTDFHPTDDMLSHMGENRAKWNEYLRHEREQLDSCGKGSYHVTLSRKAFGHASFSDGPLLNAAPGSPAASAALENLVLADELTREFLDKYLKGQSAQILNGGMVTPGVIVEQVDR